MEEVVIKDISESTSNLVRKRIGNIIHMAFEEDISWEILASLLDDFSSTLTKSKQVINILVDYLKISNKKAQQSFHSSKAPDLRIQDNIFESTAEQPKYELNNHSMSLTKEGKVESEIDQNESDLEEDILEAVRNMEANDELIESVKEDNVDSVSKEYTNKLSHSEAHENDDADEAINELKDNSKEQTDYPNRENFQADIDRHNNDCSVVEPNSTPQIEVIETDKSLIECEDQDRIDDYNEDSAEKIDSQQECNSKVNPDSLAEDCVKDDKPYQCKTCAKNFRKKHYLKMHERIHTGVKPFSCNDCSKSFASNKVLKDHERIHTDEKPFQCKTCSKFFRRQQALKIHEIIHSGDKPFKCKHCNKAFTNKCNMKTHERNHLDEKAFKCDKCPRSFNRQDSLKFHERSHIGYKPFPCGVCHKRFAQASYLKYHENLHSGEKPYQCKYCARCFSLPNSLTTHERIHTGEKPYECPTCNRHFAEHSTLTRHIKRHRNGKPYQCKNCNLFFEMGAFAEHVKKSNRCANEAIPKIGLIY